MTLPRIHLHTCRHCGEEFLAEPCHKRKFCSRACAFAGRAPRSRTVYSHTCSACGQRFETATRTRKYCSPGCTAAGLRRRATTSCPICGNKITDAPCHARKFCSKSCADQARRQGTIRNGYRMIRVDGKQVAEHRYIMQQVLGRKLLPSEVVHHRNGDKLDNRPENLEVLASQFDHVQEHRKTFSSALDRQCSRCGEIKPNTEFYLRNDRPDGLHSQCRTCQRKTPNGSKTFRFRSETHKECTRCGVIKPRTEYHRQNGPNKDPNQPHCKLCQKARGVARRLNKPL